MNKSATGFRDPTQLTNWVVILLCAEIAIAAVSLVSGMLEANLLRDIAGNAYASAAERNEAAASNEVRQRAIGFVQFAGYGAAGIALLMWIYRANWNARALGAKGMHFTPGWAVGWFFIPFLNLWKPYEAMKEIWKASANPAKWQAEPVPMILHAWWFLWAGSAVYSQVGFRLYLKSQTIDAFITANKMTMIADAAEVMTAFAAILLIRRLYTVQMGHTGTSSSNISASAGAFALSGQSCATAESVPVIPAKAGTHGKPDTHLADQSVTLRHGSRLPPG